jgi:CBS domain-containing membrane protein
MSVSLVTASKVSVAREWARRFFPPQPFASPAEKTLGGLGAFLGMLGLLAGSHYLAPDLLVFVVASMGASAVLFFAAPHSPLAQPWAFVGGHLVSALIGVTCYKLIPDTYAAAAAAVALAIVAMHFLHCLHPPGGATALVAVAGGTSIHQLGYGYVLTPVALNVALFLGLALVVNNLLPGRRFPLPARHLSESKEVHGLLGWPLGKFGLTREDLEGALKDMHAFIDVTEQDLEQIYAKALLQSHRRRLGEMHCEDVMTRDVVTAEFGDELGDVWRRMRDRKVKGIPVVDRAQRVIGMVTILDFLKLAGPCEPAHVFERLCRMIRRTPGLTSEKPEAVGQIMSKPVITARNSAHIVSLIPLFAQHNIHHVPIVDANDKLVGIVTQSDLMEALYSYRASLG